MSKAEHKSTFFLRTIKRYGGWLRQMQMVMIAHLFTTVLRLLLLIAPDAKLPLRDVRCSAITNFGGAGPLGMLNPLAAQEARIPGNRIGSKWKTALNSLT